MAPRKSRDINDELGALVLTALRVDAEPHKELFPPPPIHLTTRFSHAREFAPRRRSSRGPNGGGLSLQRPARSRMGESSPIRRIRARRLCRCPRPTRYALSVDESKRTDW